MRRTRIKICGMMRVEDAVCACEAGADAVGMIFHPGARRNIGVERAREIVGVLGPFVTPVGVFVDAGVERVVWMAREVGIRVVQLHGNETAEEVAEIGRYGLKVIKAVRVDEGLEERLEGWRGKMGMVKGVMLGVVLETAGTGGGSGVANDFEGIARVKAAGGFEGLGAVIVAGGLTVGNVGEVVRKVRPWGVDVSSGVEGEFGEKDAGKVRGFVEGARGPEEMGA